MTYYERIGVGYAEHRRPDPHIEGQVHRALGEACTVLNVGAGAGDGVPDAVDAGDGEGLGIGLTLVRNLVTQHGGQIAAHSDGPGRGSVFVIELPLPEIITAKAG